MKCNSDSCCETDQTTMEISYSIVTETVAYFWPFLTTFCNVAWGGLPS